MPTYYDADEQSYSWRPGGTTGDLEEYQWRVGGNYRIHLYAVTYNENQEEISIPVGSVMSTGLATKIVEDHNAGLQRGR
jgi:hypothetical protein